MENPKIDPRELDDIIREFKTLVPYYIPEWRFDEADQGADSAVVKIFAQMQELQVRQLNRLPEKHYMKFLDQIGVRLMPANPATVPVTFTLSEGAPEPVHVPAKTQVAAGDVIFETERGFVAAPSRQVNIVTVDPQEDAIYPAPPNIISGEPTPPLETVLHYPARQGDSEIYLETARDLGEDDLIRINNTETVVVAAVSDPVVQLQHPLEYGETGLSRQPAEVLEGVDETFALRMAVHGIKTIKDLQAYKDKPDELAVILGGGEQGVIYREKAEIILENAENGVLDDVHKEHLEQAVAEGRILPLTDIYYDAGDPVKKITTLEPYGGANIQEHHLYLGDAAQFEITGTAKIILTIGPEFADTDAVSWHYYGENEDGDIGWQPLQVEQSTEENRLVLLKNGAGEITEQEINGRNSRWLRCALHKNRITQYENVKINTVEATIRPLEEEAPIVTGIIPDHLFRNDVPEDPVKISPDSPVFPFGKTPVRYDIFYIGSGEAFSLKGAGIEVCFELAETGEAGESGVLLCWEYWSENGWRILKLENDATAAFTAAAGTPAAIKFTGPEDIAPTDINGIESHWIRVQIVDGDYGRETYKGTEDGKKVTWETDRTGINPPVVEALTIATARQIIHEYTPVRTSLTANNRDIVDRSKEINESGKAFPPFRPQEDNHRTIYHAFDRKLEKGPVKLFFVIAEGADTTGEIPGQDWQYLGERNTWQSLGVEDDTRGLTRTGEVSFQFPTDHKTVRKFGEDAYWIRVVEKEIRPQYPGITGVYLNTVKAGQGETITGEILGSADGTAGQEYILQKTPVVPGTEEIWIDEFKTITEEEKTCLTGEDPSQIKTETDEKGNVTEYRVRWKPVESLQDASSEGRSYEIDGERGEVVFGDGVNGKIPPAGTDNITADYRSGGGEDGNLPVGVITDLKTALPFLDNAANPLAAGGGSGSETVEIVRERGPYLLKHRGRAVTAEDFEQLTLRATRNIARVKCLAGYNERMERETGKVTVVVLPKSEEQKPRLSLQEKQQIEDVLSRRATFRLVEEKNIHVKGPVYIGVSVIAEVAATAMETVPVAEKGSLSALESYLNPLTGGVGGRGWDFGKMPAVSDIYAQLESVEGVDHVKEVALQLTIPGRSKDQNQKPVDVEDYEMQPDAVICSGVHQIAVVKR